MADSYFCVDKEQFDARLTEFFGSRQGSNNLIWSKKNEQEVISYLNDLNSGNIKKDSHNYYYERKYELINHENQQRIILKRNDSADPLIFKIPYEDYYDKLLEAHINTKHGGRDRMVHYLRDKWLISKDAIQQFIRLCSICSDKDKRRLAVQTRERRTKTVKTTSERPLKRLKKVNSPSLVENNRTATIEFVDVDCDNLKKTSESKNSADNFNIRGQVEIIDFQPYRDGEYYFVMCYQEQYTRFVHLRPLKHNHPGAVAEELFKIFCMWGGPHILQSSRGREFVCSVIRELAFLMPKCKVVNGRIPEENHDTLMLLSSQVENLIRTWMIDNNSSNWSRGCYEVQWQKNTTSDEIVNMTPYEVLFNTTAKCGLRSTSLPSNILNNLDSEEDLEKFTLGGNKKLTTSNSHTGLSITN